MRYLIPALMLNGAFALLLSGLLSGCSGSSELGTPHNFSSPPAGSQPPKQPDSSPINEEEPNGDQFAAVGTQPFVLTVNDPLSTFAADVDTASYDIFRRDIEGGLLPNPDSVRVEEYINAFSYDYALPQEGDEHPFTISLEAAPSLLGRATSLVRVGIQAASPPIDDTPVNLVFLMDISGSMSADNKLPYAKELMKAAINKLKPTDTVSIVTYSATAKVLIERTAISSDVPFNALIDALRASGSTDGAQGIQLAYQQATDGYIEGGINHVVLMTDGDFNVGISDPDDLVEYIETQRNTGVTFTALGFGAGNLNDELMEKTSNAGNGIYSVITSVDNAIEYAGAGLIASIFHVAKDMKIQVAFNPEVVAAYRLIGYENRALEDDEFKDDSVDAWEVGLGHSVTALYEIAFDADDIPLVEELEPSTLEGSSSSSVPVTQESTMPTFDDPNSFIRVAVRYKKTDADESDAAFEVSTELENSLASIEAADEDFQWAVAVAAFAEIIKESPYAQLDALDDILSILADNHLGQADRKRFVDSAESAKSLIQNY